MRIKHHSITINKWYGSLVILLSQFGSHSLECRLKLLDPLRIFSDCLVHHIHQAIELIEQSFINPKHLFNTRTRRSFHAIVASFEGLEDIEKKFHSFPFLWRDLKMEERLLFDIHIDRFSQIDTPFAHGES